MNKFNWFKAVGFGALVWAIMFIAASIFVGFGITINLWAEITLAIVGGIAAYLLAINIRAPAPMSAFGYGAVFVVVGVILDLIVSQQFVSGLFTMWTYYLGYALVLFAPQVELGFRSTNVSVQR
ncbi:MAG: hypothetical protein A3C49_03960 [Candidatus Doudnabacteria bacterium RIFCSPHIGHO2_02_FULL_42_25]|uniref:Uncharacterized protein n=1 Tax=Candidatus Doudnabacteria bacterium RIFCSPHIGHO2_01_FULL_41_86 TaxID=1817821 RepID=A0A1F5N8X6_9BACT|nr:MAG: hypothetical protein A2717_00755 [Candidatus Doudnabacteria bacterium RIFCSPHIGHO2_01_FULL_41_86]OGE75373.1 MAG: hypothetical protein A3K07_01265 [Candidatus Doudnabacteria bacterium RIFCSPHIGHO2_01_43_10]OGE86600.1 MAG: hypothetical protein A3E28_04300 [Candidatus Doudnabacteria bacterium RIFCSPHIGHO2_12_FULL_42_22]OGE87500.1 MAG: hypothetical protein A3C49_03960 [Candidatus Doudnabacteria bacterium RIFCSPHIGHO2_02_FULL_42_25]OGE92765.1 MAG: hypothetical protein A2895_04555 [Candidatus